MDITHQQHIACQVDYILWFASHPRGTVKGLFLPRSRQCGSRKSFSSRRLEPVKTAAAGGQRG
jgi:hypothetical protein